MSNSKTVVKVDKTFIYTLVKGEIKEFDFVVSKRYFEFMDEDGMFLNPLSNKSYPIEINQVVVDGDGLLTNGFYDGEALQKRCSIVNVEIIKK